MKSHASMNRIYRLVWNAALSVWVAVAENAKGRGKSGSARSKAALLMLVPLSAWMHQAWAADAANATVSAGAASVATSGTTTTINQGSQRAAIDWTSLSTRANEALIFNQPNAQAIALNRITGSSPSELLGSLTANGQVFILNPNGVLFGAGSQVNVGGLVASTMGMSNADFEAGNYKFTGSGGGSVVNQGSLNAAPGGYLALLAPEVRNEGVMTASLGTALLAAGNKVTLNLDNGSLLGYSIDQGAINALAENRQLIQANGGQVLLSAKAMDSLTTATVNNTGVIEAKTLQNKAGRILLMGDMELGTVNVGGTLDASAPTAGDGGFIETSAARVKVADGTKVTTRAAAGGTGKWLIDPKDFTVAASGGDMTGAAVSNALSSTNFEIATATMGTDGGSGDIHINDSVSWTANQLSLNAERNININAAMNGSGTASLALLYGQGAVEAGNTAVYKINAPVNLPAGNSLSTKLGSDGAVRNYTVITSLGAQGSTTGTDLQGINGNLSGYYALGANIDGSDTVNWNSGQGFTPIGGNGNASSYFSGIFDGLGHTITGLTINRPDTYYVGLFGNANTATIRNAAVAGSTVTGKTYVGGLVGSDSGSTISNIGMLAGSVAGEMYVGGLVGYSAASTVSQSYNTGTAAGRNARSSTIGGLMGYAVISTIGQSYATGSVTGDLNVGGLIGILNSATVSQSYATGNATATYRYAGGLVGAATNSTITQSYASGDASATDPYLSSNESSVGGLVGSASVSTISQTYATGAVRGMVFVGGLVGYSAESTISQSYAAGAVVGTVSFKGGLVGYAAGGSVTGNYWNAQVTPGAACGQSCTATGLTTAQMNNPFNFIDAGWDFTVWGKSTTGQNSGYLMLRPTGAAALYDSYVRLSGNTSKTYGDADPAASGIAFSIVGPGAVTLNWGSAVSAAMNAGTYAYSGANVLNVTTTGTNGAYVDYGSGGLTVKRRVVELSGSRTYDGTTDLASGIFSMDNLVNGQTLTLSGLGQLADKNAGSGRGVSLGTMVLGDGTGLASNYTLVGGAHKADINKADLELTANNVTKTYDGTLVAAGSAAVGSGTLFNGDSISGGSFAFTDKNAGNGNKTVQTSGVTVNDGNGGNNYNVTYADNTRSTINPFAVNLSGTRSYDGTTDVAAGVLNIGPLVGNETLGLMGTATVDKNVGANKTLGVAGLSLTDGTGLASNYTFTGGTQQARITQASLTVGSADVTKTYDGNLTAAGTATVTGGTLFAGDRLTGGTFAFTDKNAGTGNKTVTASGVTVGDGVNNGNYAVTYADNTSSTINKADLTVTAAGVDKVYDGAAAATVGYGDNRVAGDVLAVTGLAFFADKNVGTGKAVDVGSIALGGADAGNYNLLNTSATTTASITPKALTVTANNDTQLGGTPYSGGNGVSYAGLATGDTAAAVLAGNLAYGGSAQGAYLAGEYDITPGGLLANGNYSLRFVQGRLTLSSADAASAALGGTALVGAYQGSLNTVSGGGVLAGASLGNGRGKDDGGAAASGLNAAAAEAAGQDGGN